MMGGLFTVLAVIAAGEASVYFVTSSVGAQLIRKRSVTTILNDVKARQRSAPQTPLHEIYYSLAEERTQKNTWLTDFNYLNVLRDAGCFDPGTAPPPEEFAQFIAGIEETIRQGHGDDTISRRYGLSVAMNFVKQGGQNVCVRGKLASFTPWVCRYVRGVTQCS
jgi:hypothetical protein